MREFTLFSREDPSNYHGRPGDARRGGDGPSAPDSAFMKSGLCVQRNSPCELPLRGLVLAKAGSQMERGDGVGGWPLLFLEHQLPPPTGARFLFRAKVTFQAGPVSLCWWKERAGWR